MAAKTKAKHSAAVCIGNDGRARCGPEGSIILTRWDGSRYRHTVGYAGEAGIEAGVWYHLDHSGNLVRAEGQ